MRLFIAVQLSDEMKASVTGAMHELKKAGVKGSYVPSQNLHLTLAFIGETKETAAIKAAMETISFKPFRLSLSEMGTFGDLLWVGLKGNQGLSALVRSVRGALDAAGISYDDKKFVPHITIVRKATGRIPAVTVPEETMSVGHIAVMRSDRIKSGMLYTEVGRVECEEES